MLPVSPNEPKERTTGATDAQIEAAARRCWEAEMSHEASETWNSWRDYLIADLSNPASYIVPPGMVIAPAADLLTAEIKQAMKFALFVIEAVKIEAEDEWSTECFCEATHYAPPLDEENGTVEDHIDLIRAIADGGAV